MASVWSAVVRAFSPMTHGYSRDLSAATSIWAAASASAISKVPFFAPLAGISAAAAGCGSQPGSFP